MAKSTTSAQLRQKIRHLQCPHAIIHIYFSKMSYHIRIKRSILLCFCVQVIVRRPVAALYRLVDTFASHYFDDVIQPQWRPGGWVTVRGVATRHDDEIILEVTDKSGLCVVWEETCPMKVFSLV